MAKVYLRKITKKSRYSYALILPKEIMAEFKWKNKQKVIISSPAKNRLLIKDWKKKKK